MSLKNEFHLFLRSDNCSYKYAATSADNCCNFFGRASIYLSLTFKGLKNNDIFECDTYEQFLNYEKQIRESPLLPEIEENVSNRWIGRGIVRYEEFLLYRSGLSEDLRCDYLDSVVVTNKKEGSKIKYFTTKYERNHTYREAAIKAQKAKSEGLVCQCCGFDFEKTYGERGKGFIEVHHIKPLFSLYEEQTINPETDLVCICSNCHRMIHRKKDKILSISELRNIIRNSL
ncbi:MAG: HNH endonuclease [Acutalibacteraceae bacterium]